MPISATTAFDGPSAIENADTSPFAGVLMRKKDLSFGKSEITSLDLSDFSFMDVQILPLASSDSSPHVEISAVSDLSSRDDLGKILNPIQLEIQGTTAKVLRKGNGLLPNQCLSTRTRNIIFGFNHESLAVSGACNYKALVYVNDEDIDLILKQ